MTNSIAIFLGVGILGCIAADIAFSGGENLIFLGKKMVDMIEWLAFWR